MSSSDLTTSPSDDVVDDDTLGMAALNATFAVAVSIGAAPLQTILQNNININAATTTTGSRLSLTKATTDAYLSATASLHNALEQQSP
jgi:hypothetical protein